MPATLTVAALLATADDLLTETPDRDGPLTPAGRDRGAAYALRIALEVAVDAALATREGSLREVSMRAKLLCLRHYSGPGPARRVNALWNRLSAACKFHHDELGPTHAQVRAWYAAVESLVAELCQPGAGIEFPQQKGTDRRSAQRHGSRS
ncbi:hypothetical protein [Streptomyces sp. NRRL S-474]|uniref:hypothetical protein n=2 Tax=unclassified Streptomyces TaxID=2593676 RepID=UPI0006908E2F|nr:hypothetical protein [Streptomyces sp. NRRL S-474]